MVRPPVARPPAARPPACGPPAYLHAVKVETLMWKNIFSKCSDFEWSENDEAG